ncbi:MAG: hypothetical protein K2M06_09405, partial [Muribaculaceae bacterium]|nr:hypothetical protein [Muribaculaceae bacterium]
PATPSGGTYTDAVPTASAGWTDAPEQGTAPLWMSRARFSPEMTGAASAPKPVWSTPSPVQDSTGIEYLYSQSETDPGAPADTHPFPDVPEAKWNKNPVGAVWMAMAVKNNGAWELWSYTRIKGESGKNVIFARLDPQVVEMKSGTYKAYVDVYDGGERVPASDVTLPYLTAENGGWITPNMLKWTFIAENGRIGYMFTYLPSAKVDMDLDIEVTYKGRKYPVTIPLRSLADGEDGKPGGKGDKGDDAVSYSLILSPSSLTYDLNSQTYDTSNVHAMVLKTVGQTQTEVTAAAEGLSLSIDLYVNGAFHGSKPCQDGNVTFASAQYSRVDFVIKKDGKTVASETLSITVTGRNGTNGKNGVWVPPPMQWKDYDDDYTFQCGDIAKGETRLDMALLMNTDGNLFIYNCIKTHQKKNGTPPSGEGNTYWKKSDTGIWKFLATDLLWANVGQINFLSGQAFRVGDQSGVCGYFGVPVGGAIFYSGGDNVSDATYVVYANGRIRSGSADGKRIEIDPASRRILIYGSDGELCAIHSGDMLDHTAIGNATGNSTATAAQAGMQKTLAGAKTESLAIVGSRTAGGDGTLKVSTPKFLIRSDGTSLADPDALAASCLLAVEVLFGSEVVECYIIGGLVEASQSYTSEAFSFSVNVPKGTSYSVRLRYVSNLDAFGHAYFTAQGNATADLSIRNKVCHYGANGWFVSVDNRNFSYCIYDQTGRMHQKTVSGGAVMFDTDMEGKHF